LVVDNNQYIEALKEMRSKTVDKAEYEKLAAENKRLINDVLNGVSYEQEAPEKKVDIQELRNKLFNKEDQTNLEYITNVLELRKALIESGHEDPFVPQGSQYNPTQADYEKATRVATVLQEMVDDSEGDPAVFRNEYQRRVKK
jgi:siderophore synthetase component